MTGATSPPRAGWWWGAISFAAIMAMVGVLRPRVAAPAAVITALGIVGVLVVYRLVRLFGRLHRADRSEFAPMIHVRPPHVLPHHIARIAPQADDKNPVLSIGARAGIVTVATERLWAHHGLNLHDPTHHAHIERCVSADLWSAIRPDRVDHRGQLVPRQRLLHRDLDRLLDDLEST